MAKRKKLAENLGLALSAISAAPAVEKLLTGEESEDSGDVTEENINTLASLLPGSPRGRSGSKTVKRKRIAENVGAALSALAQFKQLCSKLGIECPNDMTEEGAKKALSNLTSNPLSAMTGVKTPAPPPVPTSVGQLKQNAASMMRKPGVPPPVPADARRPTSFGKAESGVNSMQSMMRKPGTPPPIPADARRPTSPVQAEKGVNSMQSLLRKPGVSKAPVMSKYQSKDPRVVADREAWNQGLTSFEDAINAGVDPNSNEMKKYLMRNKKASPTEEGKRMPENKQLIEAFVRVINEHKKKKVLKEVAKDVLKEQIRSKLLIEAILREEGPLSNVWAGIKKAGRAIGQGASSLMGQGVQQTATAAPDAAKKAALDSISKSLKVVNQARQKFTSEVLKSSQLVSSYHDAIMGLYNVYNQARQSTQGPEMDKLGAEVEQILGQFHYDLNSEKGAIDTFLQSVGDLMGDRAELGRKGTATKKAADKKRHQEAGGLEGQKTSRKAPQRLPTSLRSKNRK